MPEPFAATAARKIIKLERETSELNRVQVGYSMGDVIGTVQGFPMLRGFWPFSSINESGNAYDLSGQGRILTNNGTATFGIHNTIIPYTLLNGTTQYFSRADEAGLDMTGAITWGGWFYFDALGTANQEGVIGKHLSTGNQRAYEIYLNSSSSLTCSISTDGAFGAGHSNEILSGTIATQKYYCLVGRFTPSTELALFVSGTKFTNTTAIGASIFNATAAFEIGRRNLAATFMAGRAALCFACAAALPDSLINRFFKVSRTLFGV